MRLESEIEGILRKHVEAGLLESIWPLEMEAEFARAAPLDDMRASSVSGKWVGSWGCNDRKLRTLFLSLTVRTDFCTTGSKLMYGLIPGILRS
jgi:hypothetical protein